MNDYFYGPQADLFSFYRMPKVLFQYDRYKYLSAEAKVLYGLLLDRMDLSAKSGWIDEKGRVYIIYTIEEIMEHLNCGNKKAGQLLSELEEKADLIERQRQGLGRPNLIYVKNFLAADVENSVERHFKKCQNDTSGSVETTSLEVSKRHGINTDNNNTDYSDTDSLLSDRNVGSESEEMRLYRQYENYFRKTKEMDILLQRKDTDSEILNALIDLLVETCCSKRKTIRINKQDLPLEVVKSRFMKLECDHMEYVLHTLSENTTRVRDMKQYMLATLYNAPVTIGSYYQNWVSHDQAGGLI